MGVIKGDQYLPTSVYAIRMELMIDVDRDNLPVLFYFSATSSLNFPCKVAQ